MAGEATERVRVVASREPNLEELAMEVARDAPADFCAQEFPIWSWPWRLARRLQALPGVTAQTNAFVFRAAVRAFCEEAQTVEIESLLSERFTGDDRWDARDPDRFDDVFAEFLAAWPRIRIAEGQGPLELAFAQAKRRPIIPNEPPSVAYVYVVSTAYYLQIERNIYGQERPVGSDVPIFLPAPRMGHLLDKTPQHVGQLVNLARDRCLLIPVDETSSYTKRQARTFRFNLAAEGRLYRLQDPRRAPNR